MTGAIRTAAGRVHAAHAEVLACMHAWVLAEERVIGMQRDTLYRLTAGEPAPPDSERRAALTVLQRECRFREWERARQDLRLLESALCTALEEEAAAP